LQSPRSVCLAEERFLTAWVMGGKLQRFSNE
jgi:hypothetical protein